jgi:hypothetical protein
LIHGFIVSYQTGSSVGSGTVITLDKLRQCAAGRCEHAFAVREGLDDRKTGAFVDGRVDAKAAPIESGDRSSSTS